MAMIYQMVTQACEQLVHSKYFCFFGLCHFSPSFYSTKSTPMMTFSCIRIRKYLFPCVSDEVLKLDLFLNEISRKPVPIEEPVGPPGEPGIPGGMGAPGLRGNQGRVGARGRPGKGGYPGEQGKAFILNRL